MTCRIWRNWKKLKPIEILERDNYQCQFCKLTIEQLKLCFGKFERLLIVLIDENDQNNQPENLVTLCYTCYCESFFVDSPVHKYLNQGNHRQLQSKANAGSCNPERTPAVESRANAGSCNRERNLAVESRANAGSGVLNDRR